MASSNEILNQHSDAEIQLAQLSAAAAKFGMRLVSIDTLPETESPLTTNRQELLDFSARTQVAPGVAFRGWRRLQELYTSKVQYEAVGIRTRIPFNTPLIFRDTEQLPTFQPELPESWIGWRQRLTDLDCGSFHRFVIQLDNAESRFGRNPQADLLGKGNGPTMHNLFKGFAEQLTTRD